MGFRSFILREDNRIDSVFAQTEDEINSLFSSLYNAVKRTWGKVDVSLGDKKRSVIISNLYKVIKQLETPKQESIEDIESLLNEAIDLTSGLSTTGKTTSGTNMYDFQAVLNNIKHRILQSLQKLKDHIIIKTINKIPQKVASKLMPLNSEDAYTIKSNYLRLSKLGRVSPSLEDAMSQTNGEVKIKTRNGIKSLDLRDVNAIDNYLADIDPSPSYTDDYLDKFKRANKRAVKGIAPSTRTTTKTTDDAFGVSKLQKRVN